MFCCLMKSHSVWFTSTPYSSRRARTRTIEQKKGTTRMTVECRRFSFISSNSVMCRNWGSPLTMMVTVS